MKKVDIFGMCVVVLVICLTIAMFTQTIYQLNYTPNKCVDVATLAKDKDLHNSFVDVKDWWGNPIRISRTIDNDVITYTATSAGRDQKFDTNDDISRNRITVNYAKKIGSAVGAASKQFVSGFTEGLEKKTKFDDKE
jgi:hypothetical protein